jgi:hypothetical protein
MKCRIPVAVPPPGGTGTDLELDLKWRGSEDAVRVWCVARAVQPSFGDFPGVAVALAGAGSRVEGLVAVAMTHWVVLSGAAEERVVFWVRARLVVVLVVGEWLRLSIAVEMVMAMRMAVRKLVR